MTGMWWDIDFDFVWFVSDRASREDDREDYENPDRDIEMRRFYRFDLLARRLPSW